MQNLSNSNTVMKIIYFLFIATISLFVTGLSSCGGGGNNNNQTPEDPQTVARNKLTAGTWALSFVTRDDINVNSDFTGFNITFTLTGYSVEKGGTALPGTGSWTFDGTSSSTIIFDGTLNVSIAFSNDDNNLRLTFTIPETDYTLGRQQKLQGTYVFDLVKG